MFEVGLLIPVCARDRPAAGTDVAVFAKLPAWG